MGFSWTHFVNSELECSRHNYGVDFYTTDRRYGKDINIVYSEVYHLAHKPNVVICYKQESVHDYTYASKEKVNQWARRLVKKSRCSFFNEDKDNMVFKQ